MRELLQPCRTITERTLQYMDPELLAQSSPGRGTSCLEGVKVLSQVWRGPNTQGLTYPLGELHLFQMCIRETDQVTQRCCAGEGSDK